MLKLKCKRCNNFLALMAPVECAPGSDVTIAVEMNCAKCKTPNVHYFKARHKKQLDKKVLHNVE